MSTEATLGQKIGASLVFTGIGVLGCATTLCGVNLWMKDKEDEKPYQYFYRKYMGVMLTVIGLSTVGPWLHIVSTGGGKA